MTNFICTTIAPNLSFILLGAIILGMLVAYMVQNKFGLGPALKALFTSRGSMFRNEPHLKRSLANTVFFVGMLLIAGSITLDLPMCEIPTPGQ